MKRILLKIMFLFFISLLSLAESAERWDGPITGPKAQRNKTIVFIASDFKNGGVVSVYRGFEETLKLLDWNVRLENGNGNSITQEKILNEAIKTKPDGIVFAGFSAREFKKYVAMAKKEKIALVGWHADAGPGPTKELFFNITTHPDEVAKLAADFVIKDAMEKQKKVGVVIFNDNEFPIANLKTEVMKNAIQKCKGYKDCKVLAVENVKISEANKLMPEIALKLNSTYGTTWTYSLAINDVYYDGINYPLLESKRTDIRLISAGDGSERAINRVTSGNTQQVATIAEPLRMQGFQIADELNRAFAGEKASGYISHPLFISTNNIKNSKIDDDLNYDEAYYSIWNK